MRQVVPMVALWAAAATDTAAAHARADKAEADRGWQDFLDRAAMGGAGTLHRITKPLPADAAPVVVGGMQLLDPREVVAAKRAAWAQVWQCGEPVQEELPAPWLHHQQGELPPLSVESFQLVLTKFKGATGMGSDLVHPQDPFPSARTPSSASSTSSWPSRGRASGRSTAPASTTGSS